MPVLTLWGFCCTSAAMAAAVGPEAVLKAFLGPNGIPDKKSAYTGEMLEYYADKPTFGQGLPKGTKFTYRLLHQGTVSEYAVVINAAGETRDFYIFFRNDGGAWRMSAVRTLALPGFFYDLLHDLSTKKRSGKEEREYQNMLLTSRPDADLKAFLVAHVSALDDLVRLSRAGKSARADGIAKSLFLDQVGPAEGDARITAVSIGGILDNSVGFLFVPDGVPPPEISPSGYILVEKVAGHWYLYKTT